MKKVLFYFVLVMVVLSFGCAGSLRISQISVDPLKVDAGATAKMMMVFKGPKNNVTKVIATVRENPDIYFSLNDQGKDGDEKAGDNIWTYVATIPEDAPPMEYHLDFSAYDKENNEIITEGLEKQSTGRSGTVVVTVK